MTEKNMHLASNGENKTLPVGDGALGGMAREALEQYFHTLNGHKPAGLYDLVIGEIERPLFKAVLDYAGGNQSLAATILGINRGTLRKKLRLHGLLD